MSWRRPLAQRYPYPRRKPSWRRVIVLQWRHWPQITWSVCGDLAAVHATNGIAGGFQGNSRMSTKKPALFGGMLRRYRTASQPTQTQLAARSGAHQGAIAARPPPGPSSVPSELASARGAARPPLCRGPPAIDARIYSALTAFPRLLVHLPEITMAPITSRLSVLRGYAR